MLQVRTLEAALEKDFDVNGRSQGWARPGIDMDREDFIDIATVCKKVPGKTPAQVHTKNLVLACACSERWLLSAVEG